MAMIGAIRIREIIFFHIGSGPRIEKIIIDKNINVSKKEVPQRACARGNCFTLLIFISRTEGVDEKLWGDV